MESHAVRHERYDVHADSTLWSDAAEIGDENKEISDDVAVMSRRRWNHLDPGLSEKSPEKIQFSKVHFICIENGF